ncbi:glycosyltransferase family 2 protein [Cellulomonas chengniuliangii]|uniref:Glycosyltransferase family 2 protein n=1 Tax=Cellulomonas chengniuliangii TaxID=2968084 RepID=A0ABY5KZ22_9CELL|nr:glycosyltransferase family 2 protein [Cellulomonas chengniuliangii]MCC2308737.1 glycosyltransferase family 2 protein [Cellulomonas chengniuliangii]UUI74512.1 glycosyltransferase family 2 protein [Cellulomonas chengniuliangii]
MPAVPLPTRLLAIIPAWNEQETVADVVAEIRSAMTNVDVLVVDDGSTDRTATVAREAGATVLTLPINLGVGGAMRAGYKYALRSGYSRTVQIDADGQHDPQEIHRLLTLLDNGADIAIGARFAGVGDYVARGPRRWSMRVLSSVLSRVARTHLTDTTSGFKACNARAVRLFAANYPAEYLGDTIESLVIASRAGLVVRQDGVKMRPRAGGQPSHSPVKAAIFLGRAVLALVIALSRPTEPLGPEAP